EAADALRQVVDAVLELHRAADDAGGGRVLARLAEDLLADAGELRDGIAGHYGLLHLGSIAEFYGEMITGVPATASGKTFSRIAFGSLMQPFETFRPIDQGSSVPWIATGPPCAQPVRTFEYAETPIASGP